jgi:hypothetical protein
MSFREHTPILWGGWHFARDECKFVEVSSKLNVVLSGRRSGTDAFNVVIQ